MPQSPFGVQIIGYTHRTIEQYVIAVLCPEEPRSPVHFSVFGVLGYSCYQSKAQVDVQRTGKRYTLTLSFDISDIGQIMFLRVNQSGVTQFIKLTKKAVALDALSQAKYQGERQLLTNILSAHKADLIPPSSEFNAFLRQFEARNEASCSSPRGGTGIPSNDSGKSAPKLIRPFDEIETSSEHALFDDYPSPGTAGRHQKIDIQ